MSSKSPEKRCRISTAPSPIPSLHSMNTRGRVTNAQSTSARKRSTSIHNRPEAASMKKWTAEKEKTLIDPALSSTGITSSSKRKFSALHQTPNRAPSHALTAGGSSSDALSSSNSNQRITSPSFYSSISGHEGMPGSIMMTNVMHQMTSFLDVCERDQLREKERLARKDAYRNEMRQQRQERHELFMARARAVVRTDHVRKGEASRRAQDLESCWLEVRDLVLLLETFEKNVDAADAYLSLYTTEPFIALRKTWVSRRIEKFKRLEALEI